MGIDTSGGMIVGCKYSDVDGGFKIPESYDGNLLEYLNDIGADSYAPWYDADDEDCIIGFPIDDIDVSAMYYDWVDMVKDKAYQFEFFFRTPARLIGTQDIY